MTLAEIREHWTLDDLVDATIAVEFAAREEQIARDEAERRARRKGR